MTARWKYEFPRLVNLDENPATGARNTVCSSGGMDSCGSGSCDASSTCYGGTYARICETGSTACSLTKNAGCCQGSGVTSDTQYACSCSCYSGSADYFDMDSCYNGQTACATCSWGYGTKNSASGCFPGNGN